MRTTTAALACTLLIAAGALAKDQPAKLNGPPPRLCGLE